MLIHKSRLHGMHAKKSLSGPLVLVADVIPQQLRLMPQLRRTRNRVSRQQLTLQGPCKHRWTCPRAFVHFAMSANS